jgi:hypothetical protein
VVRVNERGQKRFLAIEDGVRESKQSWRELLLGQSRRLIRSAYTRFDNSLPPQAGEGALTAIS